jgi:hypothetical protein
MEDNTQVDAAVFRRLLKHLDENKDVQNIELMNVANFCRNCLAKWYVEESSAVNEIIDLSLARERVYGMGYEEWKENHQKPATAEQLEVYNNRSSKIG